MQKYLRLAVKTLLSGTAKDTYLIFSSNIFSSFLAFLYTIFLVRIFSPENLGIFSSITAFILLTSDVLDMGITTSLSRFYPEIKKKEGQIYAQFFINNTFIFKITITLLFSLIVVVIAPYFSFLLSLKFIRLKIIGMKFSYKLLKKLMSYSVFIAVARIFSAVSSRFDALMLIPLSSSYEAGIYSAAYKIIFTYILLSGSFSMVIAPRLSSFSTVKQSLPYLKKVILAVIIILLTMVFMYIVAPVFVPFILGDNYYQSIPVFRALLLPAALFVSTIPSVNFLLYVAKKPQISAFNTIVSLLIIFFGNLYFIPHYGRLGPVFTLTLAYGFTVISSSLFTFYYLKHG